MAGRLPLDPDAQAFLTAAGIADNTITIAINTLVLDLKGYGLWTKMKALYPFVGGTATTHKFNLKDPQDTNAAFRLVFAGGWTHSANGAQPNGVNAYANTFLNPSLTLNQNSVHLSYYSRTLTTFTDALLGAADLSYNNGLYLLPKNAPNNEYTRINQSVSTSPSGHPTTRAYFIATRTSSSGFLSYSNLTLINNVTVASSGITSNTIFIGSANISPIQFTACESALASIGDGLTPTESFNLYTAVQAFQTTLGRQV